MDSGLATFGGAPEGASLPVACVAESVVTDFRSPLDPAWGAALNDVRSREIPDKGLRNRWPFGSAEIL
jgi:hypothetical protein